MAGIHPSSVIRRCNAHSRKRNSGFERDRTLNVAALNDQAWVESCCDRVATLRVIPRRTRDSPINLIAGLIGMQLSPRHFRTAVSPPRRPKIQLRVPKKASNQHLIWSPWAFSGHFKNVTSHKFLIYRCSVWIFRVLFWHQLFLSEHPKII